jgi:hypothetical protein
VGVFVLPTVCVALDALVGAEALLRIAAPPDCPEEGLLALLYRGEPSPTEGNTLPLLLSRCTLCARDVCGLDAWCAGEGELVRA